MQPGVRYALMQVPGIAFIGLLLVVALRLGWMSETLAWSVFGLWVLKDAAFYPVVAPALRGRPRLGPERMIGETAVVVRDLDPEGTVRVAGELWRARVRGDPIAAGVSTRIESVVGLTLWVRRLPDEPAPGA